VCRPDRGLRGPLSRRHRRQRCDPEVVTISRPAKASTRNAGRPPAQAQHTAQAFQNGPGEDAERSRYRRRPGPSRSRRLRCWHVANSRRNQQARATAFPSMFAVRNLPAPRRRHERRCPAAPKCSLSAQPTREVFAPYGEIVEPLRTDGQGAETGCDPETFPVRCSNLGWQGWWPSLNFCGRRKAAQSLPPRSSPADRQQAVLQRFVRL
jgi:hypothetical protein